MEVTTIKEVRLILKLKQGWLHIPQLVREVTGVIIPSLVVATLLTNFVIVNAVIPSGSMIPTLNEGDRVVATRLYDRSSGIQCQDVIVFYKDIFDKGKPDFYIKRVIGCPGDIVTIMQGQVSVNGEVIQEPYIQFPSMDDGEFKVPKDSYFVMGDNRASSFDSRMWKNPYVHISEVRGVAIFKYYPELNWIDKNRTRSIR